MKKNGFTLVEVLAVITIVSVMAVITVTAIQGLVTQMRQKAYNEQQNTIKMAAKFYFSDNKIKASDLKNIGDVSYVKVTTLQENGYIGDIVNPLTGDPYDSSYSVKTTVGLNNKLTYEIVNFSDDLCFNFNTTTGTITAYNYLKSFCGFDVVLPTSIGGINVLAIGDNTFNFPDGYDLTGLDLSNATYLQTIGNSAFRGNNTGYASDVSLDTFNLGNLSNLVSIGTYAFAELGIIGPLDLSGLDSLTTIGDRGFRNNDIDSLTLSSSITSIGQSAFYSNSITTLTYPDGNVTVGDSAFSENAIVSVTIPANVTVIASSALYANSLTSVTLPSGLQIVDDYAFSGNMIANSVIIPNSVTTIGDGAFGGNSITSVTLSNTLVSIGIDAFSSNALTSISIPNSVTSIGTYAFVSNALTSITMGRTGTTLSDSLLAYGNNNFRTSYTTGGAGTYTGTQSGTWTKI